MPQAELTIQLRVHFSGDDAEEKLKAVIDAGKMCAKHWQTTAMLLADKRQPQVMLQGSDFIVGAEEISLADDIVETTDDQRGQAEEVAQSQPEQVQSPTEEGQEQAE